MKHIGIKRLKVSDIEVVCMYCKKTKDEKGAWTEASAKNKALLSHGVCPECLDSIWKPEALAATFVAGSIAKVGAASIG